MEHNSADQKEHDLATEERLVPAQVQRNIAHPSVAGTQLYADKRAPVYLQYSVPLSMVGTFLSAAQGGSQQHQPGLALFLVAPLQRLRGPSRIAGMIVAPGAITRERASIKVRDATESCAQVFLIRPRSEMDSRGLGRGRAMAGADPRR